MTDSDSTLIGAKPGEVLAGKYRVERVLGAGGMGVVVAAHHLQLDERVALKFLLPSAVDDPGSVTRFTREARAAVKIKSEHVARVIDVGQLDSGAPYMVMEYLEGTDLAAKLAADGVLPAEQAVDFVLQACEAIAEAHSLGIVHRDLKPANLFCLRRADGHLSVKVLDFGISKVTAAAGARSHALTQTNSLVGSPLYMAPEHLRSPRDVDARADIWSLGVILYELVAGRPPFLAETLPELTIQVVNEEPPPLESLVPTAPPGLGPVIAKALAKDPKQRYQNVGDLALALDGFGSRRARISIERVLDTLRTAGISRDEAPPQPVTDRSASRVSGANSTPSAAVSAPAAAAHQTHSSWTRTGAGATGRGRVLLGLTAAAIFGLAAGGVVLLSRRGVTTAEAPPPAAPAAAQVAERAPGPGASALAAPPDPEPAPPEAPAAAPASSPSAASSGTAPPAHARPAPAPPAAKADCNPPYTINAKGSRVYKKECL